MVNKIVMRIFAFLAFVFIVGPICGQEDKIEKHLHYLKSYRDDLTKKICKSDSFKLYRCEEKNKQFLNYSKKYLSKIDSLDKEVAKLNNNEGKWFYYLDFGKVTYYDWGDCNIEIFSDSSTRELLDRDPIDCNINIKKTEKFHLNLSGFSTGQTLYREDFNGH